MLLPLVPGALALAISLAPGSGALATWCRDYWWLTLLVGGVAFSVVSLLAPWTFRCPTCTFRLARAGISPLQFLSAKSAGILHCPHCGVSWTADEPQRGAT